MNLVTSIIVKTQSKHAYLVRGLGKRAVLVVLGHFPCMSLIIDEKQIITAAAMYAVKKGYKRIFVKQDVISVSRGNFYNFHQRCDITGQGFNQNTDGMTVGTSIYEAATCILCDQGIDHSNCDNGY